MSKAATLNLRFQAIKGYCGEIGFRRSRIALRGEIPSPRKTPGSADILRESPLLLSSTVVLLAGCDVIVLTCFAFRSLRVNCSAHPRPSDDLPDTVTNLLQSFCRSVIPSGTFERLKTNRREETGLNLSLFHPSTSSVLYLSRQR